MNKRIGELSCSVGKEIHGHLHNENHFEIES